MRQGLWKYAFLTANSLWPHFLLEMSGKAFVGCLHLHLPPFWLQLLAPEDSSHPCILKADLTTDPHEATIITHWSLKSHISCPKSGTFDEQATLDSPLILREISDLLLSNYSQYHQARLRAVSAEQANDRPNTLAIASCKLHLRLWDNQSHRQPSPWCEYLWAAAHLFLWRTGPWEWLS